MLTNETKRSTLYKTLGDASRGNPKLIKLAKHLKVSVHMVQSVALGRRNFSDKLAAKVEAWCNRG